MSIQQSGEKKKPDGKKGPGQSPTKKTIKAKKDEYCKSLVGLLGDLKTAEANHNGYTITYELKKCCFVKTEKNYRITRNLELLTGVELRRSSEEIKKNVTAAVAKNTALATALSEVCKAAKAAKAKFSDLRSAAADLDKCRKDSCNCTQMIILGCPPEGPCAEKAQKQQGAPKMAACDNACTIIDHLVNVPESLLHDADVLYSAATEIKGIQTFTSIKSLEKFQADFDANVIAFDDLVIAKMKTGKTAVDTAQDELVAATKDLTSAGHALFNARNKVESTDDTKDYLCCSPCKCLDDDDECGCHDLDNPNDRLKKCKQEICEICDDVTGIYCGGGKDDCQCAD